MIHGEELKRSIREAFSQGHYPGDRNIKGSDEGEEPFLLEDEFKGQTDWRNLDAHFIDQAPDGYGSALSFFSDEAFRFYIPAYLIADIDQLLDQSTPVFHLTHGLANDSKNTPINPQRYGAKTWFHEASRRFALFNTEECTAIVAYLTFMAEQDSFERQRINEAIPWPPPRLGAGIPIPA